MSPKKKDTPKASEIRREKRKLLKILILLAKVYKKGAKTEGAKTAYETVAEDLKNLRKNA